jgi:hypothetical protein
VEGNLGGIDALLGCPIVLFDPALASDGDAWASLPGPSRAAALSALFHAVAWLRETINAFGPQVNPASAPLLHTGRMPRTAAAAQALRGPGAQGRDSPGFGPQVPAAR